MAVRGRHSTRQRRLAVTNRYAAARTRERLTDADQHAYAKHVVEQLRGRPVSELAAICDRVRDARPLDTRTAVAIADAGAEAADRHAGLVFVCRHCRESFTPIRLRWQRYCSPSCARYENARNTLMHSVEDARVVYADHIENGPHDSQLTVHGHRWHPGGHESTVVVDLDQMDDTELHLAANAFLRVLYRRWPRESRIITDRHHEVTA